MKLPNKNKLTVAICIAIILDILFIPITVSAWGDSDGGRPSYSLQQINEDVLGDQITFNSIEITDTDNAWYKEHYNKDLPQSTITHEKNFVGARENTNTAKDWSGNDIVVEDGKEYSIRLYVHNDNPNDYNAIAENVKVAFSVPETSSKLVQVNGFIESSNAVPNKYWDYVNFQSDVPFHLEYVYGSALLENNGFASVNNIYNVPGGGNGPVKLSDDIVDNADGTLIGFYGLDGRVPGCYKYAEYVTIRVKVVYDHDFLVEKKVRMNGTKEWSKTVEAKVGDKVDFQIQYKNTSDQRQADVIVKDTLPSNLRYVPGTIKIKNGSHPNGDTVDGDALVTGGLKVGSYGKNSNVYLMFTAEVVDDNLACGSNTLVNWAQAMVGDTVGQDFARVVVQKGIMFQCSMTVILITILVLLTIILVLTYKIQQIKKKLK